MSENVILLRIPEHSKWGIKYRAQLAKDAIVYRYDQVRDYVLEHTQRQRYFISKKWRAFKLWTLRHPRMQAAFINTAIFVGAYAATYLLMVGLIYAFWYSALLLIWFGVISTATGMMFYEIIFLFGVFYAMFFAIDVLLS